MSRSCHMHTVPPVMFGKPLLHIVLSDCVYGQQAAEMGPDHAFNCPNDWGLTVARHDELAKAVRGALSRAGATHYGKMRHPCEGCGSG